MPRLFWTALIIGVVAADAGSARLPGDASQEELHRLQAQRLPPFNPTRVVDRIMSFDRDGDGRITKDELPERMQELIARHDRNDDGALTFDEARASVDSRFTFQSGARHDDIAAADEGLAGVINDLKLTPSRREQALAIVQGHTWVLNINEPAVADVYAKIRQLLDAEEYTNFEAAARRLAFRRGVVGCFLGGVVR
jgi:hypothetical protein